MCKAMTLEFAPTHTAINARQASHCQRPPSPAAARGPPIPPGGRRSACLARPSLTPCVFCTSPSSHSGCISASARGRLSSPLRRLRHWRVHRPYRRRPYRDLLFLPSMEPRVRSLAVTLRCEAVGTALLRTPGSHPSDTEPLGVHRYQHSGPAGAAVGEEHLAMARSRIGRARPGTPSRWPAALPPRRTAAPRTSGRGPD